MNRNSVERFGAVPKIHAKRASFDLSHSVSSTWNNGLLIPLDYIEVLPGDTIEVDVASVIRMSTPLYPVMDNLVLDMYWMFVPNRLTMEHWPQFWGENDNPWIQNIEYNIPQIKAPAETGWTSGTVADYFGLPIGVPKIQSNHLYFRSYIKIWNDWFRSEVTDYCCYFPTDESTVTGENTFDREEAPVNAQYKGVTPLKVNKTFDYFTAGLKSPQKGPSVSIPIGTTAPVTTGPRQTWSDTRESLEFRRLGGNGLPGGSNYILSAEPNADTQKTETIANTSTSTFTEQYSLTPSNLWADLSSATASTVNELRTAFAIQKYFERVAQGSRYIEWLRNIFGVESSDARMQRSEYIGGMRLPINMSQVLQTSSSDSTSPQGHASGFSCTVDNQSLFTKSFEEHGILMCCICTRIESHSYQQGLRPEMFRKKWTDYYNPYFAFLGNQKILNKEIFAQGPDVVNSDTGVAYDEEVFAYKEAWSEYRYIPNFVTGEMRSNISNTLDAWHYADDYENLPTLSDSWLKEGTAEVDRTLAVSSAVSNQFHGDFWFKIKATRCMPLFSVPGLIDHV